MGKDEDDIIFRRKPNKIGKKSSTCKPCPPKPCDKSKPEETKFECKNTEKLSDFSVQKGIEAARNKCSISSPEETKKPKSVCDQDLDKKPCKTNILGKKTAEKPILEKPKIILPKVNLPRINLPKINLPQINLPKINLPKIKLPKINLPKIPKIELNKENVIYALKFSKDWCMKNCNPKNIKKMADKAAAAPGRPMKYPYTFSAKFAQFPLKHYINNQWIWKYYFVSVAVCIPVFYSINKLANSPGNVAKWAEIRRKEAAEHHH